MVNGKKLKFDPKFEERPAKDQISYLQKLAFSQNSALEQMQNERNELRDKLAIAEALAENADKALQIQKKIVLDAITNSNALEQETAKRIQELEARVKAQDSVIEAHSGNIN